MNLQNGTCNMELVTWNLQHGTCNMELASWNLHHGTWKLEHGIWNMGKENANDHHNSRPLNPQTPTTRGTTEHEEGEVRGRVPANEFASIPRGLTGRGSDHVTWREDHVT